MLSEREKETKVNDTLTDTDEGTMCELMRLLRVEDTEEAILIEKNLSLVLCVRIDDSNKAENWVLEIKNEVVLSVQRNNEKYEIDTVRKRSENSLFYWSNGRRCKRIQFYAPFAASVLSGYIWTKLDDGSWEKGSVGENVPFTVEGIARCNG
ncbi:hypothetical protein MP638_006517 [Amoeboaphelidium occidentale]|nr:hypothetical protein MP638_006517 [Amoeboaphelidium occidentale]